MAQFAKHLAAPMRQVAETLDRLVHGGAAVQHLIAAHPFLRVDYDASQVTHDPLHTEIVVVFEINGDGDRLWEKVKTPGFDT